MMAGIRGARNPMPKAGGKPTNIFSTTGKQKNPPLGSGFKPGMTATAMDKPRKGPVKRNNGLK
jgi:hypothetical protein